MEPLIRSNIHFLGQAERLLEKIGDADYCCGVETFYGSTLGQHLRHCLDHYRSMLDGLPDAKVDYDHRTRQAALETSTATAISEVRRTALELEALLADEPLVVNFNFS